MEIDEIQEIETSEDIEIEYVKAELDKNVCNNLRSNDTYIGEIDEQNVGYSNIYNGIC